MNIVLTGFMGCGKTTVGKALAEKIKKRFIDTDELIQKTAGKTISEIFAEQGEKKFRKLESKTISQVSKLDNQVIATGGGSVLNPENLKVLNRNGVILFLNTSNDVILKRIENQKNRPLMSVQNQKKQVQKLMKKRMPFYTQADYILDANCSITEIVNEIQRLLCNLQVCTTVTNKKELAKALEFETDLIELRLDQLHENLNELITISSVPVIVKVQFLNQLPEVIRSPAAIVDLDIEQADDFAIQQIRRKQKLVLLSFHDFQKTPSLAQLTKILNQQMQNADIGKIVTLGTNTEDIDAIIGLLKIAKNAGFPLIAFLMGESQKHTRTLMCLKGSLLTYAHVNQPLAVGQSSLQELKQKEACSV
ncbi:MAG: type I 3-dehydroquinate dehydratase [Candidatus Diapherotrites archaeon]|nr:type I 3-dehydroquinate dehydratase [Candidatus Diapherotrites archaeon]